MPRSQATTSTNFFAMLPRRSVFAFFAAVFFVFSPIGLLLGSSFVEQRPIRILVFAALLSGCIAVSWAATFTLSRWWLAGVVGHARLERALRKQAERPLAVAPGDLLALYTDGLNETENAAGEQLGHEPIARYVAERAGDSLHEIQGGIFDLARRHGDAVDDQTVLLVRIN